MQILLRRNGVRSGFKESHRSGSNLLLNGNGAPRWSEHMPQSYLPHSVRLSKRLKLAMSFGAIYAAFSLIKTFRLCRYALKRSLSFWIFFNF